jgi:DNA-directed DNA polymerase III PolC
MQDLKSIRYKFAHHHLHTEYSPLDAPVQLKRLVKYSKELGYRTVTVTDHGTVGSWVKLAGLCKDAGLKPIFGVEGYLAPDRKARAGRDAYHCVLLAKNNQGVKNIYRIMETAYREGLYYNARFDWELLEKYKDGVICTSACVSGIIPQCFYPEDGNPASGFEKAKSYAHQFKDIFGKDFYCEVQCHGFDLECKMLDGTKIKVPEDDIYANVAKVAHELDIPIVGTNDVHCLRKEDANTQEVMMAISTKKCIRDESRMRHESNQFYLKSPDEMIELFGGPNSDAVQGALAIADMCNAELNKKTQLPSIEIPKEFPSDMDFLEHLARKGLRERGKAGDPVYEARLQEELDVIRKIREKGNKFDRYFLVVWDYVNWAKTHGIRVGVGRGSGAGSLILYCLRITGIDPIPYGLLFERFLTEDRTEMPDIDIDFDYDEGHRVYEYVCQKYGVSHCARICTNSIYHVASAIKAAFRAFDPCGDFEREQAAKQAVQAQVKKSKLKGPKPLPVSTKSDSAAKANEITQLLPKDPNSGSPSSKCTFNKELADGNDDYQYIYADPVMEQFRQQYPEVFKVAEQLEGMIQNRSIHAAGVLITEDELVDVCPQQSSGAGEKREMATVYDMNDCDKVGCVKFDFLRTKALSVLTLCLQMIKERYGVNVDVDDNLDLHDKETIQLFNRADTTAVFQFESDFMKKILKDMNITCFEDIIAANALGRPGPMQYIPIFCRRKSGKERVQYAAPAMQPILKNTYGVIVYQEQVMQIVRALAAFTAVESDAVRKAMGKKKKDILDKYKSKFAAGVQQMKTMPGPAAGALWSEMEAFASYAFNKSVDENTVIPLVEGGYKKIKNMRKGDRVFCRNKNYREETEVVAIHDHGILDGVEVTFDDGHKEICSIRHKFLTPEGMMPLHQILRQNLEVLCHVPSSMPLLLRREVQNQKRNAITSEGLCSSGNSHEEKQERSHAQCEMDEDRTQAKINANAENKRSQPGEIQQDQVGKRQTNSGEAGHNQSEIGTSRKMADREPGEVQGDYKKGSRFSKAQQGRGMVVQECLVGQVSAKEASQMRCQAETGRLCQREDLDRSGRMLAFRDEVQHEVQIQRGQSAREGFDALQGGRAPRHYAYQIGDGLLEGPRKENPQRRMAVGFDSSPSKTSAGSLVLRRVVSARAVGKRHMYDLEVCNESHNFELSNGVITSNSHAAAYSYTAFQEAYLKVHYPAEYMAAQLSVEGNDSKFDVVYEYERATRQMDIDTLPLDINLSRPNYYVVDHNGVKAIRRGFKGIKGIGENAYTDLTKGQKYKDMFDFCSRAGAATSSDVAKVLAEAGAMDCFLPALAKKLGRKAERKDLQAYYEENMRSAQSNKKTAAKEKHEALAQTFSTEISPDEVGG